MIQKETKELNENDKNFLDFFSSDGRECKRKENKWGNEINIQMLMKCYTKIIIAKPGQHWQEGRQSYTYIERERQNIWWVSWTRKQNLFFYFILLFYCVHLKLSKFIKSQQINIKRFLFVFLFFSIFCLKIFKCTDRRAVCEIWIMNCCLFS